MEPLCHICSHRSVFFMDKDGFSLYRCPSCALVFVSPQPSAESLEKQLYSYESGYQANRVEDLSLMKEQARALFALNCFVRAESSRTVLDVGCGNGQFLYWARQRGFAGSGVELN